MDSESHDPPFIGGCKEGANTIARYRTKDEVDLRWNAIRRAATARVDLEVKTYREKRLNDVLTQLWTTFSRALGEGDIVELEPEYEKWVSDALDLKALGDGAA